MVVLRGGVLSRLVAAAHFFQLLGCVECIVGVPLLNELVSVLAIEPFGLAFALAIRSKGAGMKGALIGVKAAPGEAIEYIRFGPGYVAALVSVFDAKDKVAVVLACKKIIV
jgi:hypothetical protein